VKLKTTAIAALCGVVVSTAAAFAVPLGPRASVDPSLVAAGGNLTPAMAGKGPRVTVGDTLLVDARLGHAALAKGAKESTGETYLFASVAADDKTGGASASVPAAMNLAVVIDRSGSMKGERIANAMGGAVAALERMRPGDTISVVSFDTSADVVVAPTRIDTSNKPSIEAAIRSIRLGGDTCISCGLEEGMRQLVRAGAGVSSGDRIDRMVLLSDGATNAGIRDLPGIRAMAGRMRGRGVTISTIGVDVDFDEKIMAAIATEANGRHYFVANAAGLPAVFGQEFDELLASVAKETELTIELAPGVEVAEVFDRAFRREGDRIIVPFGTFSAKEEKTVLLKLRVPTDRDGEQPVADLRLAYRDLAKRTDGSAAGSLALAVTDAGKASDLDPFVAARLERSRTAQTLTEANRLFEAGRVTEAQATLEARKTALQKTEVRALALASAAPATAAPRRSAKALDRDFKDQSGALADAARNFAPAPPAAVAGGGVAAKGDGFGRFAPAPPSREGKAQVRANQEAATSMGFGDSEIELSYRPFGGSARLRRGLSRARARS
jgi:Ca-activated chloride channel family protein